MTRLFATVAVAALMCAGIAATLQAQANRADVALRAAIETQTVKGDLRTAIEQYKKVVEQHGGNRPVAAQALLRMAECYRNLGAPEAERLLQRLIAEYGDQQQPVAEAQKRLASLPRQVDRGAYAQREVWSGPDLLTHLAPNAAIGFRARPSADGRWLVFVDRASHGNVALRDVATGEVRLITKEARGPNGTDWRDAQGAFHPRLSPDGTQVAYQWGEGGEYSYSVRICPTSGGRPRVLLRGEIYATDIAWAPDGSALAMIRGQARGGTDPHIALISVADGTITRLKSLPYRAGYQRASAELGGFSPDGRHLVYAVPNDIAPDQGGVFAIARDGSHEAALVPGRSGDTSPVWAPDGNAVIFVSDRSVNYGLWSVKVANGKAVGGPELLRGNVGPVQALGFARDGSLFFGRMTSQDDALVAELDAHGASVTPPALLVDSGIGANRGASWSPDGRYLAFVRSNGSEDTVIVRRPDGTERKLATRFNDGGYGFAMPSWLPDSRSLLVPDVDRSARRSVIRKVHIDTLQETVVLEGANWDMRRVTGPSPDGKYLYYSKGERMTSFPQTVRLVRRDLSTGAELELHRSEYGGGPAFYNVALSPDGRRIAFTVFNEKQAPTLTTVSTAGDEAPRQIIRSSFLPNQGDTDQTLQWSKDGRRILITSPERADIRRVWAFPVDGSEPQRLDLAFAQLRITDLSADGRRLALSVRNVRPEVGVMTNLLGSAQASR
jgi:Tol biopolymer transport system component